MKKVGIVSCYYYHNYGSMLQAYATQLVLDKRGIENETIDTTEFLKNIRKAQYAYILKAGVFSEIFWDKLGKAKNVLTKKIIRNQYTSNIRQRDRAFDQFAAKHIRKSIAFTSLEDLAQRCEEYFGAILIGSDQLWTPSGIATDYFTLGFVPPQLNTVAYATSFGVSSLPIDIVDRAKNFLRKIKHISVREQSGQKLIEDVTGRRVPVVLDPTLLLSRNDWDKIRPQASICKGKYILCYFIGKSATSREFAQRLKKVTNCKIVALPHVDGFLKIDEHYADDELYDIGPAEFINLIRYAEYVCTDSFHGTVFSIIYQKKFYLFHRYTVENSQSTNDRLYTLLKTLGLTANLLRGDENIPDCLKIAIDYDSVSKKLEKAKKYSFDYLETALDGKRSTDL